jgi:hypothetical protein
MMIEHRKKVAVQYRDYTIYSSDLIKDLLDVTYYINAYQMERNLGNLCSAINNVERALKQVQGGNTFKCLSAILIELKEEKDRIMGKSSE